MNTQAKNERSVATVVRQKKQDDEFEEQIRKATETAIKNMRTAKVKWVNALAMKVNEMIWSDGKIKEWHSSAELAWLVKNMKEELSETTDVLSVTQSTLKDRLLSLWII